MAILDLSGAPWGGKVKLLPDNAGSTRTDPRLIVLHTIVGDAERTWNYFADGTNLESTFLVAGRWYQTNWPDGYIVQAMDTTRKADAQYRANSFAISIETEDDGSPEDTPWTARQLDALAWLIRTCARIHDIPIRKATSWDGSGVGWHAMWGAPSPWTPVAGKTCPGRARIAQIPGLLERARNGGQEADMATIDDIYARQAGYHKLVVEGDETHPHNLKQVRDDLAEVRQLVQAQSGGDAGGSAPVVVQLSGEQLAKLKDDVVAELRSGLAQPIGAHLAALMANGLRAGADQLTTGGGLV